MNENTKLILSLADGQRTSVEIAAAVGLTPRYVRKVLLRHDAPRLGEGGRRGEANHEFAGGRRITLGGYVKVTPPEGYTTAKPRPGRKAGYIFEHRLVMEQKLGRHLLPTEIVDHVDGLTLHNHPDNLRLFASNAEHLRATLAGQVPQWSEAGFASMKLKRRQHEGLQRVDTYRQRKEAGAIRLRQILLAALQLGINSPYLLGTTRHTTKAGIDMSSRSTIELALAELSQKWGWGRSL